MSGLPEIDTRRTRPGSMAVLIIALASGITLGAGVMAFMKLPPNAHATALELPLLLPEQIPGSMPLHISSHEVYISIDALGQIRLAGNRLGLDALSGKLKEIIKEGGKLSCAIRADKRVPLGLVAKVLGILRDAGVNDVAVLTTSSKN